MKITSLKIRGIGPHSSTVLDFGELGSPLAIVAPYGSGKTSLLESILICLYGSGGWYSGNAYDLMTQNGTGKATIELAFEHDGENYLATREIKDTGKTKSQTATLWVYGAGTVAGPKVSDFEAYIATLLGDFRTFLATQFLSQNRAHDLCGQPGEANLAARRREVFGELLEVSGLDDYEAKFAEIQRLDETEAKILEHQMLDQSDPDAALNEAEERLGMAELEAVSCDAEAVAFEQALSEAEADLAKADNGDAHRLAVAKFDAAWQKRDALKDQTNDLLDRVGALTVRANDLENATNRVVHLSLMREDMGILKERMAAFLACSAWEADFERHKTRVAFLEQQIADKAVQAEVSEETKREALALQRNIDLLTAAKARNAEAVEKNKATAVVRLGLEREIAALESQLADLRKRTSERPETPGGAVCETCPLVAQYAGLPIQIAGKELRLGEARSSLTEVPAPVDPVDLSEPAAAVHRSQTAASAVFAAAEAAEKVAEMKKRLGMEEAEIAAKIASKPQAVADPTGEIDILQRQIDVIAGAEAELKAAERAADELNTVRCQHAEAVMMQAIASKEAEELRAGADAARLALKDVESARQGLVATVTNAKAAVAASKLKGREAHAVKVKAEADVARWHDVIDATREKRAEAERLRGHAAACRDLRACFGPRGVRQILVDSAAPALEKIADDLFDRATGGKQRLRIATQKTLSDGGVAEDFSILVADDRGERDATRFSGGQLQLIQILFRLSVALWVGRVRGRRPNLLILDEAFDRLGAEGAEDLLRVLDYLSDEVSQIIVVSHDPAIAARLRSQVVLRKTLAGVTVA